ncbi:hypothetical protein UlMin_011396 [Ulmus minor]
MAEYPKLDSEASLEVFGLEEKMGSEKISVSDRLNGFHYSTDKSDNFVIDMESFSHAADKDIAPNPRIKLQRSLSRKAPQRGSEKKINSDTSANDRDSRVVGPSPRGSCTPEKPTTMAAGTTPDNSNGPQVHHQITITAGNISSVGDGKCVARRNSFKRSSWTLDPKRILLLFATLSSMGTILLIYMTLSINKYNGDETSVDWQQP